MSIHEVIEGKCATCYTTQSAVGLRIRRLGSCAYRHCPLYTVRPRETAKKPLSQVLERRASMLFDTEVWSG